MIGELQYLEADSKEAQRKESEKKLDVVRALIQAGVNPNPVLEGEELLAYLRFKICEQEKSRPALQHFIKIERLLEETTGSALR